GFTTKDTATVLSGRGIGLDFVYNSINKCGGTVKVQSTVNKGTRITMSIPVPEF
ncbi:MAG: hypothetical protein GX640_19270, partial [Fibrobacter sp.]|nr:hypothetical protein [Fibrobacter sp.]